jgi:hypothetical protein
MVQPDQIGCYLQTDKSFLLLFFKKDLFGSFSLQWVAVRARHNKKPVSRHPSA